MERYEKRNREINWSQIIMKIGPKITKGTKLNVRHNRKGQFIAIATTDFDIENDKWYPLKIAPGTAPVYGAVNTWEEGEEIPCRASFCKIEPF